MMNPVTTRGPVWRRILPVGCLAWIGVATAHAQFVVDPGGQGTHTTIQSAIDDADDGFEIVVMPGTYFERIDFSGKAVRLRGSAPANAQTVAATVIDGQGIDTVVTFASGEGPGSVLQGFTVRHGDSNPHGGGIICVNGSSPRILANRIVANTSYLNGAGLYCASGASPLIRDNVFFDNQCNGRGGAIYAESGSPLIEHNVIDANSAGCSAGGGVYLAEGTGGAVLRANDITRNFSRLGGGVAVANAGPRIERNRIVSNVGFPRGGGVSLANANVTFTSNIVAGNRAAVAGAVDCAQGVVVLRSNSFIGNWATDAAILTFINGSQGDVVGNVFAFNRQGVAVQTAGGGSANADYNCLFGNTGGDFAGAVDLGPNNLFDNPLIIDVGTWMPTGLGVSDEDVPCEGGGQIEHVAHFSGPGTASGYAQYRLKPDRTRFDISLTGFPPGQHGVFINDVSVGQIFVDGGGNGDLEYDTNDENFPPTFPNIALGDIVRIGTVASSAFGPGWTGTGDVWLTGDEHLQDASPCRDAGPPSLPPEEDRDIDGQPRISGAAPDTGADEVVPAGNGDADADGDVDFADLADFQLCFRGSDVNLPAPQCAALDLDGDADVDLDDWQSFEAAITGPG